MSFPALVDCRDAAVFCQGHMLGASCLPANQLAMRMHELPQRNVPLVLCGDGENLVLAETFLSAKGYQILDTLVWSADLITKLQAEQRFAVGMDSPRLWQPAPLITYFVHEVLPAYQVNAGVGLDIACGAGRDMVYLALNGWQMTGVDYLQGSLDRACQLAQQHQVQVTTTWMDLETNMNPFHGYADESFDLICIMRYLHRPLYPHLQRLLKPNGFFIQQTFMQGCEKFGSPKNPNFLLRYNELASIFSGNNILLDDIVQLDDGRPVSAFIARRPN